MRRLASSLVGLSLLLVAGNALAGALMISEFRLRGRAGALDEFIEIYNNTGADHVVASSSGTGYGVAASDGVLRATIPNGTVIPNHGHFLIVNSAGYSLGSYPAGSGTAAGDATYTADIADNAGIALFETNVVANFSLATRLDAVGSTAEGNTLYKEGGGYPALAAFSIDYSFYRRVPGTGTLNTAGVCRTGTGTGPVLVDSEDNESDFVFVDTNGTSAGAGQRLGAPGPENLSSPISGVAGAISNTELTAIDTAVAADAAPNWVRDTTSDPANNSMLGTVEVRRRFTNLTGAPLTRLRFRVIDLNTFPAASGYADLRPRTSTDLASVATSGGNVVVRGTTLEQPPMQPNGGGFNSTFSVSAVSAATPLASGASINVRFLLGVQQQGYFPFFISVETLPTDRGLIWGVIADTQTGVMDECPPPVVAPAPTTTTLTSAPNPSTFGQTITLTATVAPAATGTITFFDGTTALGTATLSGSSQASRSFSNLDAGTHSLTAQYGGDPTHAASTSAPVSQVINPAATSITLASSLNPSIQTQTVTFTVTVTPPAVSGTVSFFDNGTRFALPAVVAGKATWTVSTLAVGVHSITASYDGSANYLASAVATLTQTVQSGGGGGGRGGSAAGGAGGAGGTAGRGAGGLGGSAGRGGIGGSAAGGVGGRGGSASGGAGGSSTGTAGVSGAGGTAGRSGVGGAGTAGAGGPGSGGVVGTAGSSGEGGGIAGTAGASGGGTSGSGVGGGGAGGTMVVDGGVDGPGAGGHGGTAGAAGGKSGADASADGAGGGSDDGCSCATTGSGSPPSAGVLLVALGAILVIRRRRERR